MVTPVFRITNYEQALDFYVNWLGFRIDWEDLPKGGPVYTQVSRGELVLHLSGHEGDSCLGAKARVEMRGLLVYHSQLLAKNAPHRPPSLGAAAWHNRVLEMEVVDPFSNCLVFCELGVLDA